jgi:hypothetical protein
MLSPVDDTVFLFSGCLRRLNEVSETKVLKLHGSQYYFKLNIPTAFAKRLNMKFGDPVMISVKGDAIVMRKQKKK